MTLFQGILLAIGIVILVIIYFISRKRNQSKPSQELPANPYTSQKHRFDEADNSFEVNPIYDNQLDERVDDSVEPNFTIEEDDAIDVDDLDISSLFEQAKTFEQDEQISNQNVTSDSTQTHSSANYSATLPNSLVVLHLKPKSKDSFWGKDVFDTLEDYQLKLGAMHVFHYQQDSQRIFSIANMVEPGTFDVDKMISSRIKGLTAFMQLDQQEDVIDAFNVMIKKLGEMADILEASIYDQQHAILTNQSLDVLRSAIEHYEQ